MNNFTITTFSKKKPTTSAYKISKTGKVYAVSSDNKKKKVLKGGNAVEDCPAFIESCLKETTSDVVGSGGFGFVKKISCSVDAEMKTYAYKKNHIHDVFIHEVEILNLLLTFPPHRNIVKIICKLDNVNHNDNAIIMECAQSSLFLFLSKETKQSLNGDEKNAIMHNLIQGMNYMHSKFIIHNDIKSENILIMPDFSIKYCDFGISVNLKTGEDQNVYLQKTMFNGTKDFMTPEAFEYHDYLTNYNVFQHQPYIYDCKKKDYWCLGVVFFQILNVSGSILPYSLSEVMKLFDNNTEVKNKALIPEWLRTTLLEPNPDKRSYDIASIKNDLGLKNGGYRDQKKTNFEIMTPSQITNDTKKNASEKNTADINKVVKAFNLKDRDQGYHWNKLFADYKPQSVDRGKTPNRFTIAEKQSGGTNR